MRRPEAQTGARRAGIASEDGLREKLETLDGSRVRANKRQQAVRIDDLGSVLRMREKMSAVKAAGAAPTAAEFDALLADVEELWNRVREIHDALQKKLTL
jgi:hypothetical protein